MIDPISEFHEGKVISKQFQLVSIDERIASTGSKYYIFHLKDDTGKISGFYFQSIDKEVFEKLKNVNIVFIEGIVEKDKNSELVIKITHFKGIDKKEDIRKEDIFKREDNIEVYWKELEKLIDLVDDGEIKKLLTIIFSHEKIRERYSEYPAAKSVHHIKLGGLLRHTIEVAKIAYNIYKVFPDKLDKSLLIAGALLHDLGKIEEYEVYYDREITDRGRFLGHIIMGVMRVRDVIKKIGDFSPKKAVLLEHIILSHHGRLEYNSPVVPLIPEAFIIHYADEISTKLDIFDIQKEKNNKEENWSNYVRSIERKLYIGDYNDLK